MWRLWLTLDNKESAFAYVFGTMPTYDKHIGWGDENGAVWGRIDVTILPPSTRRKLGKGGPTAIVKVKILEDKK